MSDLARVAFDAFYAEGTPYTETEQAIFGQLAEAVLESAQFDAIDRWLHERGGWIVEGGCGPIDDDGAEGFYCRIRLLGHDHTDHSAMSFEDSVVNTFAGILMFLTQKRLLS